MLLMLIVMGLFVFFADNAYYVISGQDVMETMRAYADIRHSQFLFIIVPFLTFFFWYVFKGGNDIEIE